MSLVEYLCTMHTSHNSEALSLLRSLIREAIRTLPGSKKFNMRQFSSLESVSDMLKYASERLQPLGQEGSARRAFLLSSGDVIKISLNSKGVAQSKHETKLSDMAGLSASEPMITNVRDHDSKFRWIIAELVRPVRDADEFESLSGMPWTDFREGIIALGFPDRPPLQFKEREFLDRALELITSGQLHYGDLVSLEHWGVTTDRRLVLLDYGTSKEIWRDMYGGSSVRPDKSSTAPRRKRPAAPERS